MRLYVANIPFTLTEEELRTEFEKHGEVESVKIITDRETGRPKGFGFIEMPNVGDGQKAIELLNGAPISSSNGHTRELVVDPAREREERPKKY